MPGVHVPQSGQAVEALASVGVLDDRAAPLDPDAWLLMRARVVDGVEPVRAVGREGR